MKEPVSVIINVYNEAGTIEAEILDIYNKILAPLPGLGAYRGGGRKHRRHEGDHPKVSPEAGHSAFYSPGEKGLDPKALKDAFALVRKKFIFFSDTGGKFDFDDFWKLDQVCDRYELVIGIRSGRTDQPYRKCLTATYNFLLRKYFGVDLRDADSGFRIYARSITEKLSGETWVNKHLISPSSP